MILVCVMGVGSSWFGVAHHGDELVATSAGPSRERALGDVERCLPAGVPYRVVADASELAADTVRMLAELESGNEREKRFTLSGTYVPEPLRSVLRIAASIPLGYVSSYGNIATAAGTQARAVGRVMATNPLYPIVPCHRVVGADLSLVGYGGRQDMSALYAKLTRLRREIRGHKEEALAPGTSLAVYPVEWAIAKALRDGVDAARQLPLFG
jgi:O-6-methylguanine DNA methyltransferase